MTKSFEREYCVIGLRRSGNHAILQWLIGQIQGTTAFLNNLDSANFLRDIDQTELNDSENLVYSIEDYSLAYICSENFQNSLKQHIGSGSKKFTLLIMRDPFNLTASRMKSGFQSVAFRFLTFIDLWCQYADEALNKSKKISGEKIIVNYNLWCMSEKYRRGLCQKLELCFTDKNFNLVSDIGGGSSFDGTVYDGKANSMNTAGRWKIYKDNKLFVKTISDKGMYTKYRALFNVDLEIDDFVKTNISSLRSSLNSTVRAIRMTLIFPLDRFYKNLKYHKKTV